MDSQEHRDDVHSATAVVLLEEIMNDPRDRLALVRGLRDAVQDSHGTEISVRMLIALSRLLGRLRRERDIDVSIVELGPAMERAIRADERFAEFAHAAWRLELVDKQPESLN